MSWFKVKKFDVDPDIKNRGVKFGCKISGDSFFYNLFWKHVEKLWKRGKDEKPKDR